MSLLTALGPILETSSLVSEFLTLSQAGRCRVCTLINDLVFPHSFADALATHDRVSRAISECCMMVMMRVCRHAAGQHSRDTALVLPRSRQPRLLRPWWLLYNQCSVGVDAHAITCTTLLGAVARTGHTALGVRCC